MSPHGLTEEKHSASQALIISFDLNPEKTQAWKTVL